MSRGRCVSRYRLCGDKGKAEAQHTMAPPGLGVRVAVLGAIVKHMAAEVGGKARNEEGCVRGRGNNADTSGSVRIKAQQGDIVEASNHMIRIHATLISGENEKNRKENNESCPSYARLPKEKLAAGTVHFVHFTRVIIVFIHLRLKPCIGESRDGAGVGAIRQHIGVRKRHVMGGAPSVALSLSLCRFMPFILLAPDAW